jgi:UPF0755 protein
MRPKRLHIIRSGAVCDEQCWECRLYDRVLPLAFLAGVLVYLIYFVTLGAPLNFPTGTYLRVPPNQTVAQVAQELKAHNIIRSSSVFEALVRVLSRNRTYAGEYFFSGKENAIEVARRLAYGDFELVPVRMTFVEGITAKQMSDLLGKKVPDFDANAFLAEAQPREGYLFPDTYYVLPGEDPQILLGAMQSNFQKHIIAASSTIASSTHPLADVVIMASLLEREAPDMHDRQVIAGILWHRMSLGMPLQVDAVFPYILNKPGTQLTHDDLKVDSPYNTYTNKGLPPGAIANPGMTSILAAVTPIKTSYLYYLSDKQGNFHFCATYGCQQNNVRIYYGN